MAGHGAAFDQPLDLGLNALGEPYLGTRPRQPIERRAPALDILPVVRQLQFPELDRAWPGVRQCFVHRISIFRMDAAIDGLVAKHVIDRLQDRRSRAERIGERYRIEFQPGIDKLPLQSSAAAIEFARYGALERKDRLLLVADRKDRARDAVARAFAGGKFGNDVRDDIPLPGAGVLGLVDQHVIDAAVELVMDPAGGNTIQHRKRLVDQIVVVEQAALLLLAPVIRGR